jgi:hypothetical protein
MFPNIIGYSKSPRLVLNDSENIDLLTQGKLLTIDVELINMNGSSIRYDAQSSAF